MDVVFVMVLLGAAAAGFAQGLSGFAFAMISMSFWAWVLEPQTSAVLVVVCSLIGQLMTIKTARAGFDWRRIMPFLMGGVMGVPIGALIILPWIDQSIFRVVLGAFLLFWSGSMLFIGPSFRIKTQNHTLDGGIGIVGGIMGGLGGLAGAIPTLWCSVKRWDKSAQRAVIQSFNLSMHIVTLTTYILSGLLTAETTKWLVVAVPAMLIPSMIGNRLYAKISDAAFRRLVLVLLFLSGVLLLGTTLPRVL
ncbi:MAG: sulfite exporter TauE/SafE family protein [Rhodospirillaceae bacterium]|nr:sulfite exporter TauE/SafE family protein [Rhodospirillaceae bacterium]